MRRTLEWKRFSSSFGYKNNIIQIITQYKIRGSTDFSFRTVDIFISDLNREIDLRDSFLIDQTSTSKRTFVACQLGKEQ